VVSTINVATTCSAPRFCLLLAGAVLILEDVGEAPYRIQPCSPHWRLCGALNSCGLGLGSFH